jgi:hypothetical protein
MTEEEIRTIEWNFIIATYESLKTKIKEPLGSVGLLERMLIETKLMDLRLRENFSQESLHTNVEVHYQFVLNP